MTAEQFRARVLKSGIQATFYEGWATRNRGQRGDGWGQTDKNPTGVHGVMLHHTVTSNVPRTISLVRDIGQPQNDVPPPLYAGVVDKGGHLHMVGWGRCNHAGLGDDDVLRAVIAENATPFPNETNTDGNARFYGFAGINLGDGVDPWPTAQLETLADVAALVCRYHGWTRNSVIGHREWTPGKVDPRGPQPGGQAGGPAGSMMPRLRGMVHEAL